MQIKIPELKDTYDIPKKQMHPYTNAEQAIGLPRLNGKLIYINHSSGNEAAKTAERLVAEVLGSHGIKRVNSIKEAKAVVWIQGGTNKQMYAFVIADPNNHTNFLATECGPHVFTTTIMSAVCEFFSVLDRSSMKGDAGKFIKEITELNRALTGAGIEGNMGKVFSLMTELKKPIENLGKIGSSECVKPIMDALGDSVQTYVDTGNLEAFELARTSYRALCNIGEDSIPWLEKGLADSRPAIRKWSKKAIKEISGIPWWKFW